jgi:hypothetical protein
MQIKEMTWTNVDSHYSLEEKPDGSIELSVDGRSVAFQDRQALRGMIEGWNRFDQQNNLQKDEPPKVIVSDQSSMPVSSDFPKKIRNAIFIMVAVGLTILLVDSLQQMM